MTLSKIFLFLLVLFLLSACTTPEKLQQRKCTRAQQRYERAAYKFGCPLVVYTDSVFTTSIITHYRDTTITVYITPDTVRDSVKVVVENGLVNSEKSRLDTEFAYATAQVRSGKLFLELFQKPGSIDKTIKDAIKKESKKDYKQVTKTITNTVTKPLTPWQLWQLWLGRIFMMVLSALLIFGLLKIYLLFK